MGVYQEHFIESRFTLLDYIPLGVFILQENMKVVFWNKCLENWTNISRENILYQPINKFFPHLLKAKYHARIKKIFQGSPATIFSSQLHKHFISSPLNDDQLRVQHTIVTGIPRLDDEGYLAMLVIQDVTELTNQMHKQKIMREQALKEIEYRKKVEKELFDKQNELEKRNLQLTKLHNMNQLLQNCNDYEEAYSIISKAGEMLFSDFFGGVVLIKKKGEIEKVINWENSDHKLQDEKFLQSLISFNENESLVKHFSCSECQCLSFPLKAKNQQLGFMYLGSVLPQTIDESQQIFAMNFAEQISLILANLGMRQTLYKMSMTDGLTGLYNRHFLDEILQKEINRANRKNKEIGIIMIDVDYFKKFNDLFGHQAGDLVLQKISNILKENSRKSDFACRYGGEELTLLLPECSLIKTKDRAETIRIAIKKLNLTYQDQVLDQITASFGVASFPEHGLTAKSLLHAADMALYQAKKGGRDCVVSCLL